MKINAGNITAVIFAAVVIGGGMVNAYKNRDLLGAKLEGMTLETAQKAFAAEGESFKQSFMGRNDLIDMYGVILNTLGKEVVGSFEFVKDKNGNMQSIGAAYDYSIFKESMTELRSAVSEDIPLMFVNLPEAAGRDIMPVADYYDFSFVMMDINEEKQRLFHHLEYFRETLDGEYGQGKKLGFIAQEMGREINTTGSKANHTEIQKIVVKMKDELEKIKEQSLNIL